MAVAARRPVVRLRLVGGRVLELRDDVPRIREECPLERPCPHVRCEMHLWRADPMPQPGRLAPGASARPLRPPELEPRWLEWPTPMSCALDDAESHPHQLQDLAIVGERIGRDGDTAGKYVKRALAKVGTVEGGLEMLANLLIERKPQP